MSTTVKIAILSFLLIVISSCKEAKHEKVLNPAGYWVLQEALRNGKPTESMNDAYFEFTEEGKVNSNIFQGNLTYKVEGDKIIQSGDFPVEYKVDSITDSVMVLKMVIREVPFSLKLKKKGK